MDRFERDQKIRFPQSFRLVIFCCLFPLFLSSCVSIPAAQERVRSAAESGNYVAASQLLENSRKDYGSRSELLYLLEKAFLLHLEGKYRESTGVFEQARRLYDQLYTKSLTGIASSFIFTDYSMDYRGEDFERILINVFQALNYCMLGEFAEARVEAKDADSKLAIINSRYPEKQKNVYREDAFCRLLMGLLYEASPDPQDQSDACLWYRQALSTYQQEYLPDYATPPPAFLNEKAGSCPSRQSRDKIPAEIYVFQYKGAVPFKTEIQVPVPLLNGYVTEIAFPKYVVRPDRIQSSQLMAQDEKGRAFVSWGECGEDIGAIAVKNLEDRKVRTIAKAAVKAAAKYFLVEAQEKSVAKHNGPAGASIYRLLSSLYFFSTNRADLRSWQTLPEKIMVTRLALEPGDYSLEFSSRDPNGAYVQIIDLGKVKLQPAQKKFFIVRSPY